MRASGLTRTTRTTRTLGLQVRVVSEIGRERGSCDDSDDSDAGAAGLALELRGRGRLGRRVVSPSHESHGSESAAGAHIQRPVPPSTAASAAWFLRRGQYGKLAAAAAAAQVHATIRSPLPLWTGTAGTHTLRGPIRCGCGLGVDSLWMAAGISTASAGPDIPRPLPTRAIRVHRSFAPSESQDLTIDHWFDH